MNETLSDSSSSSICDAICAMLPEAGEKHLHQLAGTVKVYGLGFRVVPSTMQFLNPRWEVKEGSWPACTVAFGQCLCAHVASSDKSARRVLVQVV